MSDQPTMATVTQDEVTSAIVDMIALAVKPLLARLATLEDSKPNLRDEAFKAIITRTQHVQQVAELQTRLTQSETRLRELEMRCLELEAREAGRHVEQ